MIYEKEQSHYCQKSQHIKPKNISQRQHHRHVVEMKQFNPKPATEMRPKNPVAVVEAGQQDSMESAEFLNEPQQREREAKLVSTTTNSSSGKIKLAHKSSVMACVVKVAE